MRSLGILRTRRRSRISQHAFLTQTFRPEISSRAALETRTAASKFFRETGRLALATGLAAYGLGATTWSAVIRRGLLPKDAPGTHAGGPWLVGLLWLILLCVAARPSRWRHCPKAMTRMGVLGAAAWLLFALGALSPHALFVQVPFLALFLSALIHVTLPVLTRSSSRNERETNETHHHRHGHILFGICLPVASALLYFCYSYTRHRNFGSGSWDLGIYHQTMWLLSQFEAPVNSILGNVHAFADHSDKILILLTPFFWLWNDAGMLLLLQAFAIASALPALWLLSQDGGVPVAASVLLLVTAVLSYDFQSAMMFDFHTSVMAIGPLAWTWWAYRHHRFGLTLVMATLAAICREDIALTVACLGAAFAVLGPNRKEGLAVLATGAGVFLLEHFVLFRIVGSGGGVPHMEHFDHLGHSMAERLTNLLSDPAGAIAYVFGHEMRVRGLLLPYAEKLFLGLASPSAVIASSASAASRFLASRPTHWFGFHYGATMALISTLGAVEVLPKLAAKLHQWSPALAPRQWNSVLALACLLATVAYGLQGPWARAELFRGTHRHYYALRTEKAGIQALLSAIPTDAPVAAQNHLVPHLSGRAKVFNLSNVATEVDYVIFNHTQSAWPWSKKQLSRYTQKLASDQNFELYRSVGATRLYRRRRD